MAWLLYLRSYFNCFCFITPTDTYDPEYDFNNHATNVYGRSVAFSSQGDCLFFVTQNNIWSYQVTACLKTAAARAPGCEAMKKTSQSAVIN